MVMKAGEITKLSILVSFEIGKLTISNKKCIHIFNEK